MILGRQQSVSIVSVSALWRVSGSSMYVRVRLHRHVYQEHNLSQFHLEAVESQLIRGTFVAELL